MFVIWPEQYAGTGGLNGSTWDGVENDTSVMIGIQMTDAFRHGADFNFEPGVLEYFKHLPKFEDFVQLDRWYKVDISIDWNQHIYDVRLDDVPVVDDAPFNTDHNTIARVGLYNYHQTTVWFDEIFVGRDDTMGFNTPKVAYDGVEMDRPWQTGWTDAEIGDRDRYEYMTRHGNHVLLRERYQRSDGGGLVPYDGKGYRSYISDIAQRFETGDHRPRQGGLYAGALVYLDSSRYIPDDIGRIAVNRDTRNFETAGGPWEMARRRDTLTSSRQLTLLRRKPINHGPSGIRETGCKQSRARLTRVSASLAFGIGTASIINPVGHSERAPWCARLRTTSKLGGTKGSCFTTKTSPLWCRAKMDHSSWNARKWSTMT